MHRILGLALLAAGMAAPALAADRTGYGAIAAGDLSGAERRIAAERRIFPDRPELMLNLAAVYRQTGRIGEARALYREVLSQPVTMMDLPSGTTRSSHAIAESGLARLAPTTLATR